MIMPDIYLNILKSFERTVTRITADWQIDYFRFISNSAAIENKYTFILYRSVYDIIYNFIEFFT